MLGAAAAAWSLPPILRRLTRSTHDPATAITAWLVSIVGVLATFAIGARLLLTPGDHPTGTVADLAHSCWAAVRHGRLPQLDEAVGAAGFVVLLIVGVRFTTAAARSLRSQRRVHRAHMNLLAIMGRAAARSAAVLWVDDPTPYAYSVDGRPSVVVASTALRRLPRRQAAAVFCHERAHLRGRHHLLVRFTESLAAALPFVPLFQQAPRAMRLHLEFAADAAAVRRYGAATVRAALVAVAGGHEPGHALGVAGADITLRLRRIEAPLTSGALRLAAGRGAAAVTPAFAPALLGLGALATALALSCPG
jgi:beta-lactamase regulating signal transducer with metallopeptidase domain